MSSHAKAGSAGPTWGGSGRSLWLLGLVVFFVGFLVAVLGTSSAKAATATTTYTWQSQDDQDNGSAYFGSPGGGAQGLAVEPDTGNIAVADAGAGVVQLFAPSLSGLTPIATGGEPNGIAFDPTSGALYVADAAANTIRRYVSDGAPDPTFTVDPTFASPTQGAGTGEVGSFASRIAIDPGNGDVLVADTGNLRVSRYSDTGVFLSSFDGSDTAGGAFTALDDIGVGPAGFTYVVERIEIEPGVFAGRVGQFSATGVSQGALPVTGVPYSLAVDPLSGLVNVLTKGPENAFTPSGDDTGQPALHFEGFEASQAPAYPATRWPSGLGGSIPGATALNATTGTLYGQSSAIGTLPFLRSVIPGVDTPVLSNPQSTSVHASVAFGFGAGPPPGSELHFEYSSDFTNWTSTPDLHPSSSPVETDITGLDADTFYFVRAVASNDRHTTTSGVGFIQTPLGPPRANTVTVTDIDEDNAVIYGTVNPFGQASTYHFEYGTTTAYGSRLPATSELQAGSGRANHTYSRNVTGLQANTTYHYRIVAQSALGTTEGADATFTTDAVGAVVIRGYEQVTPVSKDGGAIHVSFGTSSSPDGSALAFTAAGSPLGNAALLRPLPAAPILPEYTVWKGPNGWEAPAALDPPISLVRAFIWVGAIGISSDTTHALVASNHALAEGATEGAANLYIFNAVTGTYAYVGGSAAPGALVSFVGQYNDFNKFDAGSADFSWIYFYSTVPLLPGVSGTAMYRWSANDGLRLASVMPNGSPPAGNVQLRASQPPAFQKVSDDGETLYFGVEGDGIYVRTNASQEQSQVSGGACTEPAKACTTPVSVSEVPGDPVTPRPGIVYGVSHDGRYVVFGDQGGTPLTTGAKPGVYGNIYRYDNVTGDLRYLAPLNFSGAVDVQTNAGYVPYVSNGGETVVFFSTDSLDPEFPGAGTFLWHEGAIHSLTRGSAVRDGSQGSPSSRYYAMGLAAPDGSSQVYLYDAVTETRTCASCPPAGVAGGSASLPNYDPAYVGRKPRAVTDSGEVFFTSTSRLAAADTNGKEDVYVYEAATGRTTLVSPGSKEFDAHLVEISENGDDVFFTTAQSLVAQDTDQALDIYDARVGGGIASQNSVPVSECSGEGCRGAGAVAPPPASTGSESVAGPGNPKARKKAKKHKKQQARKHGKSHKRAGHNHGGGK